MKPEDVTARRTGSAWWPAVAISIGALGALGAGLAAWMVLSDDIVWGRSTKPPEAWLKLSVADRRQPWQVHRRAFDGTDVRPRIAVVVTGLGLSDSATEAAMQQLTGAVTLSFTPHSKRLVHWIALARGAGHEVLLELPMEPRDYPRDDPGPYTLLTSLSPEQNLQRLDTVLERSTGYVGVNNLMGSRFATEPSRLRPIFADLKRRGLLFFDGRTEERIVAAQLAAELVLPYAVNNVHIDLEASRLAIDVALADLERYARGTGFAVGIASPYPVSLELIGQWITTLERKGFALAPVTAVVNKQPVP